MKDGFDLFKETSCLVAMGGMPCANVFMALTLQIKRRYPFVFCIFFHFQFLQLISGAKIMVFLQYGYGKVAEFRWIILFFDLFVIINALSAEKFH